MPGNAGEQACQIEQVHRDKMIVCSAYSGSLTSPLPLPESSLGRRPSCCLAVQTSLLPCTAGLVLRTGQGSCLARLFVEQQT